MKYIGDFHIHSHYSIATSKQLIPEYLEYWAALKGIKVVGTGDFSHPGWIKELKDKLEPAEPGLFKLKKEYRLKETKDLSSIFDTEIRFILTAEISNIYKKNDKVRKVHNIIFAPSYNVVEDIQKSIQDLGGNITSDGRPILGLDSKDLLQLCLDASNEIFFIPSHVWTPWFSVLGAKSGFDSLEECFEDLTKYIHAVETGLSSDAPMNWRVSSLDNFTLISNSDAHSPEKLGRNANLFNADISYDAIVNAMKGDKISFLGTIDMFPQEGKYHHAGHRRCNLSMDAKEVKKYKGICPACQKSVTLGVMDRVETLADRDDAKSRPNCFPFYSTIPLKEILSELRGVGPTSKKIFKEYMDLLQELGPELQILLEKNINDIESMDNELALGIENMRNKKVSIKPGFDGEYGKINVFS